MTPRFNLFRHRLFFRKTLVYALMTLSLGAAVLLRGGVNARQWEWSALGISLAALLAILPGPSWERSPRERFGAVMLALLAGWMLFQMAPLPAAVVARLAPLRWADLEAARSATGRPLTTWAALSVAPPATFERLLDVFPAMAALLTAREMAWWWRGCMWIPLAPVVGMAWLESLAGLLQFTMARAQAPDSGAAALPMATGTYVYHNHFAGLLELAFPIAAMWALWEWRSGNWQRQQPLAPSLRAAALVGVAACLLLGVLASLSRMGFVSLLAAAVLTGLAVVVSRFLGQTRSGRRSRCGRNQAPRRWAWTIPVTAAVAIAVLLPPKELIARFAELDLPQDSRTQMWSDTAHLIHESAWHGVGVGAFEQGLYRYKTSMPLNRVDFAHNDYLQFVAELGWIGAALAGIVAVWVLARAAAVVLWLGGSPNWEFAVGVFGALLTLALHSFADFNFYLPANALAMAWLAGLAVSPGLKGK